MGDDERREILERLDALERMLRSRHDDRGSWDDHRHGRHDRGRHHGRRNGRHRGGRDDFDEKRIIDTIVRLVGERVERVLGEPQGRSDRRDDGFEEKRIVDLIVGLVSEHVREIVSTELDRRLGPSGTLEDGDDRCPPSGGPPERD